jgi:tetratricopeptide (TPR) repeat protein
MNDFDNNIENFKFNFQNGSLKVKQEISKENTNSQYQSFKKAQELKNKGDYEGAINIYLELLYNPIEKNNKFRVKLLNNLGFCCFELQYQEEAQKYFKESIKLKETAYTYDLLGRNYHHYYKNYPAAIDSLSKSIDLSSNLSSSKCYRLKSRAYSYRNNEEYDKAIKDFEQAIECFKNLNSYDKISQIEKDGLASTYKRKGNQLEKDSKYEEAIKNYELAIKYNQELYDTLSKSIKKLKS